MPVYEVFVKYEIEDSIEVEADNEQEAERIAEREPNLVVVGYLDGLQISWDNVEAYDVVEVE